MKKKFNITGVCIPKIHYMMDNRAKLDKVMTMVEDGEYFTINRPRQYGKTTTLHFLQDSMEGSESYLCLRLSFEDIDDKSQATHDAFAIMFANRLKQELARVNKNAHTFWSSLHTQITDFDALSDAITQLVQNAQKKIVLLIDEVDASSNYEPFLKFLAVLRNKYMERFRRNSETFHSVILAGVHDVKALKVKIRSSNEQQFNSPWNIAADFKVDMSFNPIEIAPMLEEYSDTEGVKMDVPAIAERLYYYTSGYPFLVCKLCKTIAENILPTKNDKNWTLEDVETSVRICLKENNTNFDSLIKNLENNQDLYDLVYRVIIDGAIIPFNPDEALTHFGRMYGIFKENGRLKIHNRIYEQRIYSYMIVRTMMTLKSEFNYASHYTLENNALDMPAVVLKFQQFMKEEFNEKDKSFLERNGRLVFLSFLTPILNGKGWSFKEVQTSEEKRLDIVSTYFQNKYIIELKRWYGEEMHKRGITQLADYLEIHGVKTGYLVIFEYNKVKSWRAEWIEKDDKRIFAVWV
jgi:hypothetical protein